MDKVLYLLILQYLALQRLRLIDEGPVEAQDLLALAELGLWRHSDQVCVKVLIVWVRRLYRVLNVVNPQLLGPRESHLGSDCTGG